MSDPDHTKLHKEALAKAIKEKRPAKDVEYLRKGLESHEKEDGKDDENT